MFPSVNMERLRFAHLDVSKCTTTICAKEVWKKLMEGRGRKEYSWHWMLIPVKPEWQVFTVLLFIFFHGVRAYWVTSVMSNSLRPNGLQAARLLCPWNLPGKNPGVGCHFLLQSLHCLSPEKFRPMFSSITFTILFFTLKSLTHLDGFFKCLLLTCLAEDV